MNKSAKNKCPICHNAAALKDDRSNRRFRVNCTHCGEFIIGDQFLQECVTLQPNIGLSGHIKSEVNKGIEVTIGIDHMRIMNGTAVSSSSSNSQNPLASLLEDHNQRLVNFWNNTVQLSIEAIEEAIGDMEDLTIKQSDIEKPEANGRSDFKVRIQSSS